MAVLLFQAAIVVSIIFAAKYGRGWRIAATLAWVVETLAAVSMHWLLLLQLVTIYVSYQMADSVTPPPAEKAPNKLTSSGTTAKAVSRTSRWLVGACVAAGALCALLWIGLRWDEQEARSARAIPDNESAIVATTPNDCIGDAPCGQADAEPISDEDNDGDRYDRECGEYAHCKPSYVRPPTQAAAGDNAARPVTSQEPISDEDNDGDRYDRECGEYAHCKPSYVRPRSKLQQEITPHGP